MASTSRLIQHTFAGLGCPTNLSYTLGHGPNAPVMNARFKVLRSTNLIFNFLNLAVSPRLGSNCVGVVDRSRFEGFVSRVDNEMSDDTGEEFLNITSVEWIDRFKGDYIFGAINIVEENGKSWHILPDEWDLQKKRIVTKEIEQIDFDRLQEISANSNLIPAASHQGLLSTATILNILGKKFGFTWTADQRTRLGLQRIKPINLDWQSGLNGADALENALSKGAFRWTSSGRNRIKITKRGFTGNGITDQFLNHQITMCEFEGKRAYRASRGNEISDSGTSVLIVGGRNSYQFTYPLIPDWNENWSADVLFVGAFDAFLDSLGLTASDKVKDLPAMWHDTTKIPNEKNGKTRNDLTIDEYMHKYPYKVFKVDFNTTVRDLQTNTETFGPLSGRYQVIDKTTLKDANFPPPNTIDKYNWGQRLTNSNAASYYPMSSGLVDNTNFKYIVFHSQDIKVAGKEFVTLGWKWMVPSTDGINVEQEEIIDPQTGRVGYCVRATFNEIQISRDGLENFVNTEDYEPDKMCITIAVDKEVFTYEKGKKVPNSRREKHQVPGLRKGFIDNQEQVIMAENFRDDLSNGGIISSRPINTEKFASNVADSLLYTSFIDRVGFVEFRRAAWHTVDGVIDNINVSFNSENGITETINFTSTYDAKSRQPINIIPNIYNVYKDIPSSAKIDLNELKANMDRLRKSIESAEKEDDVSKILNGSIPGDQNNPQNLNRVILGGSSNQDLIKSSINPAEMQPDFKIERGSVVILKEK